MSLLRAAARRATQVKQDSGRRMLPVVPSWQSGKPVWSDWSTERAIKYGLKASVWVYACVRKIATAAASVPWIVERRVDYDVWEREQGHPLEVLLAEANARMTGQDLMERAAYHLHLGGNALWHIVTARGMPVELWPIPPDRIKPVPDNRQWISHYEYTPPGSSRAIKIPAQEIVHFQFIDPSNPFWGMSPLQAAAMVVDTDIEAVRWNKVSLQNRAVADGVFTFEHPLTMDQWEEARKQVREQHQGADNAHTPWVLGGGAKWQQMSLSPVEMDFLKSRQWTVNEIAAVFGVPVMLLIPERAILRNMEIARRILWEDTVIPYLWDLAEAINLALVPYWDPGALLPGQQAQLRVVPDLSNVPALQENLDQRLENAQRLWRLGYPVNAINQRLELGMPDIEGGDEPRLDGPWSVGSASSGGNEPDDTAAAAGPAQTKTAEWSEEEKAAFWKARDQTRQQWEVEIAKRVAQQFEAEGKRVAEAYRAGGSEAALQAVAEQTTAWTGLLAAAYQAVIEHFASEEGERLEREAAKAGIRPAGLKQWRFDPFAVAVQEWVKEWAAEKVTLITETTRDFLRDTIAMGIEQELGVVDIARLIEQTYQWWATAGDSDIDFPRAMTIARTEVGAAAGFGNYEGARQFAEQTGLKVEKFWVSSRDERVRDSHRHIDGERRPLEARFSNGLLYPGDPSANDPGEVINCRCAMGQTVVR